MCEKYSLGCHLKRTQGRVSNFYSKGIGLPIDMGKRFKTILGGQEMKTKLLIGLGLILIVLLSYVIMVDIEKLEKQDKIIEQLQVTSQ